MLRHVRKQHTGNSAAFAAAIATPETGRYEVIVGEVEESDDDMDMIDCIVGEVEEVDGVTWR